MKQIPIHYITRLTQDNYKKFVDFINSSKVFGVDTETTGLNSFKSKIRLIQIANENEVYVFDLFKDNKILPFLKKFFESKKLKVFHNATFDMEMLRNTLDIEVNTVYDTMIASANIFAGDYTLSQRLDSCVAIFLNKILEKEEQLSNWKADKLTSEQVTYSALDAWILLPLRKQLNKNLISMNLLEVTQIEFDCLSSTVDLKINGIGFDKTAWNEQIIENEKNITATIKRIVKLSGDNTINLNSSAQKVKMLQRNGVFVSSSGVDTLNEYRGNELVDALLDYSKYTKLKSSFGKNFFEYVEDFTQRIHASFRQVGAYTGRYSCNKPNLMQIPHQDVFRKCFVAPQGYKMITADYSQFELRITAEVSNEPLFIKAYRHDIDLHAQTASLVFKVALEDVTKDQRDIAKRINFGIVYGIGVTTFAEKFLLTEDEAEQLINNFYYSHHILNKWLKEQSNRVKRFGYTYSASGRVVNLKKCAKKDSSPFNIAKNFPIQSVNAEVVKRVLFQIRPMLKNYGAKLVNVVHDEIVLECPDEHTELVSGLLKAKMIECAELYVSKVPIDVSVGISQEWAK